MSQEKVNQYKEEKKNRKANVQKEKRKLLNQRKQKGNCIVRLPGPRTML